jgi:hypothetical protein
MGSGLKLAEVKPPILQPKQTVVHEEIVLLDDDEEKTQPFIHEAEPVVNKPEEPRASKKELAAMATPKDVPVLVPVRKAPTPASTKAAVPAHALHPSPLATTATATATAIPAQAREDPSSLETVLRNLDLILEGSASGFKGKQTAVASGPTTFFLSFQLSFLKKK